MYEICPDTFQILSKYHPHSIEILSRYCWDIVQNIDYILCKNCMNTAQMFSKSSPNIVQILSEYCQNIEQTRLSYIKEDDC